MENAERPHPPQSQDRQPGREHEMIPKPAYTPRYAGSGRLKGKRAFITGGDSGIGRAVAILFAREGADVAMHYLEENEDAHKTVALVEAEGAESLLISGDAGDRKVCATAVGKVIDRFGGIDVLVNNCAEQHSVDDLTEIDEEQLQRTYRTNIFSYVYMTQAALPHMTEDAAIINTTSITAYRGSSHLLDYASTKAAIVGFTRSLATSLAKRKIRVNGVAPGPVWTPLIPASFDAEHVANFGKDVPLGRPGQPNEIAPAYLFLACVDSSYMTGQVLHPNGGEIIGG